MRGKSGLTWKKSLKGMRTMRSTSLENFVSTKTDSLSVKQKRSQSKTEKFS